MRSKIAVALSAAALCTLVVAVRPAAAYEHSLAGVSIGQKGVAALHRYGNPTYVAPGLGKVIDASQLQASAGPTMPQGPYGAPTGPYGNTGYPRPGAVGPYGSTGYPRPSPGGPSAYNPGGAPGALPPAYGSGNNGLSTGDNTDNGLTDQTKDLITWTYKRPGVRLDFRLDEDGHVVEIAATGTKPVPYVETARGIRLGDSYAKVLLHYGPPENTRQDGDMITVSYQDKQHIAFQFVKTKLARIDIAEVKAAKKVL